MKAGLHEVVATMLKAEDPEPEGVGPDHIPLWSRQSDSPNTPAAISSMYIGGPYNAQVPQDSPSRRLIFVCHPASAADELPCATKILSKLARRAYRRSATNDDVETLLGFYKRARAAGNFDQGIRAALERVLVGPDFLFRIEADPAGAAPGRGLSYFRCRAGFALVVRAVEQHSGRHPSRPGDPREIERAGGPRKTGFAHAGRSARA